MLELEEGGAAPLVEERVRGIFRSLHTLKGLSGMVGFAEPEAVAHALEELEEPGMRFPLTGIYTGAR